MREPELFNTLERLAANYPWEEVAIWTERHPSGAIQFTAIAQGNRELGYEWASGHGETPEAAADKLMRENVRKSPADSIEERIWKLEGEIQKLKVKKTLLALPPYRPTPYLGAPPEEAPGPAQPPAFVNVESTVQKDDVPF